MLTALVENPLTAGPLTRRLLSDAGILMLRKAVAQDALLVRPPMIPVESTPSWHTQATPVNLPAIVGGEQTSAGFHFPSVADFVVAYTSGRLTPVAVASRVLEAVSADERRSPAMRTFIAQNADDLMSQARASAQRHQARATLGPLDGVPVAIKDELDQQGYSTTVGTSFLGTVPAAEDASVVRRLREAGALLIGKTNMHEIGLGVTGVNPHHGAARNPYNPARMTGGSSSGVASAVALGLCPFGVGADGGGSIRIPSALCGIVGLKATFGRVSEHGAAPLCWSVGHVGPMAATVRDCAVAYALIAGPDPRDVNTLGQPPVHLDDWAGNNLKGLRVGVNDPWFQDASSDVVASCRAALKQLTGAGAVLVDVEIPELALLRAVHLVTIISEMAAAHLEHFSKQRDRYGLDTRVNLALARTLTAYDYVHAQRLRQRICRNFAQLLERVDMIATPATATTAPVVHDDVLSTGESDLPTTDKMIRFALPANVTGLPAISVPAGYDANGLPVGLQLMGRAWEEHTLLRAARVVEAGVERRRPQVHHELLA
jgi:Asp-tRNA(Asn)/Glu-tRNA(Gln) amidotransferase A subunit family amidase